MAKQSAVKRPSRPTIDTVTDNVQPDIGVIGQAGLTNDPRPVLSGHGDVGSLIHIRVDSIEVGTVEVGAGGAWTYQLPQPLSDGFYRLSVRASNSAGQSLPSQGYMIEVDVTPPPLPTIDHASSEGPATLSGHAQPYSTINVYEGDTLRGTATTGANSQWTLSLPGDMAAGTHALTATARDLAGNVSESSASFDIVVPAQPAASAVVDDAGRDSGVWHSDGPSDGTAAGLTGESSIVPMIDSGDNTRKLSLADVLSGAGHQELFRADGGAQVPGMPERVSGNEGRSVLDDAGYTGVHHAAQDVDLMVQSAMQATLMA
ncbi:Ig-like domain-containing protein [Burkholderia sp. 22PA0106]|uniref:Ig-like domain-containing protein n=1 Tax=Burkholderia sp. 22PA0106 TaxID=3237371 RepID=UPI0039C4883D